MDISINIDATLCALMLTAVCVMAAMLAIARRVPYARALTLGCIAVLLSALVFTIAQAASTAR